MSLHSEKLGLVEEARKHYRGEFVDKTQWNQVVVGSSSYVVERAPSKKSKINLDEIKYTYPYEKKPHKDQCGFCKM